MWPIGSWPQMNVIALLLLLNVSLTRALTLAQKKSLICADPATDVVSNKIMSIDPSLSTLVESNQVSL